MTKNEYMDKLKSALSVFDEEISNEIICDYEDHFADGAANGKSEEEIANELGSIDELVSELKSFSANDETNTGNEKTESVFNSKAMEKGLDDMIKGFAGFLGAMAATITKGAGKLSGEAETVAKDVAKGLGNAADKVAGKSTDFANVVVEKSTAFAKEVADNYKAAKGTTAEKEETEDSFDDIINETIEKDNETIEREYEGETVSEKYPCTEECKKVVIETDCGDVIVNRSDDGDFKFDYKNDGTPNQQLAYKFGWAQNGDTIKVTCKKRKSVTDFFNSLRCPDITITAWIPEGLEKVDIYTASGDVAATGIDTESVRINTVSGDILASGLNNGFTAACSVSGDISIVNAYTTAADTKSVSGDVTIEGTVGTLNIGTTSGDIETKIVGTREVVANTVSGDADINLLDATGFKASLKTVSGDLSLRCKDDSCKYIKSGTYTLGDGSCQITAGTVSGSVKVNA